MNIQQEIKELAEGPKFRNLILQNSVFVAAKYVSSTANIPIAIRLKQLLQIILAFTIPLLNYASLAKITQNLIPLKDAFPGICVLLFSY